MFPIVDIVLSPSSACMRHAQMNTSTVEVIILVHRTLIEESSLCKVVQTAEIPCPSFVYPHNSTVHSKHFSLYFPSTCFPENKFFTETCFACFCNMIRLFHDYLIISIQERKNSKRVPLCLCTFCGWFVLTKTNVACVWREAEIRKIQDINETKKEGRESI